MAAFGVFSESSPGLPLIRRPIVVDAGLVLLLVRIFLMTVVQKRDDYDCWSDYQVALCHLFLKNCPSLDVPGGISCGGP